MCFTRVICTRIYLCKWMVVVVEVVVLGDGGMFLLVPQDNRLVFVPFTQDSSG